MIKKFLIIIGILFGLMITIFTSGMIYLNYGQKEVMNTEINEIDLSKIEDGSYTGEYKGYRWSNKVEVTVKDHKITKIVVIDDMTFDRVEVTDELINRVIENQKVDVDAVSGATISSLAYLKAIENALNR